MAQTLLINFPDMARIWPRHCSNMTKTWRTHGFRYVPDMIQTGFRYDQDVVQTWLRHLTDMAEIRPRHGSDINIQTRPLYGPYMTNMWLRQGPYITKCYSISLTSLVVHLYLRMMYFVFLLKSFKIQCQTLMKML